MAQSSTPRRPLVSRREQLVAFASSETVLYVLKRVLQAALTLLLASALSFFVIQLAPGNFLDQYRQSPQFSPETLAQLETQFGLDQPGWRQYLNWLYQVIFHGNFGLSFSYQRPVIDLLWERVPNTLLLSFAAILMTWLIALPMGIAGAVNQNRFLDRVLRVLSYLGQGMPTIVTGLLLLFFAQSVAPLFPIGGRTSIIHDDLNWFGRLLDVGWHLVLPTLALSITSFAGLQRITRGQLLDVLRQNYIQTARAKGLSENRVVYVHALRNAVNPMITLLWF